MCGVKSVTQGHMFKHGMDEMFFVAEINDMFLLKNSKELLSSRKKYNKQKLLNLIF